MASAILAYAFLRASYGETVRHPIDALIPTVKRGLMKLPSRHFDLAELQSRVKSNSGLEIPINVIRHTFPALARSGVLLFDVPTRRYALAKVNFTDPDVDKLEESAKEQYGRVSRGINASLMRKGRISHNSDEFLEEWLDLSSLSFLGGANPGYAASNQDRELNRTMWLIIEEQADPTSFILDLTDIALGDALYRAITSITELDIEISKTPGFDFRKRMDGVNAYFDTRFVIRTLAFSHDELTKATEEVLSLCRGTGCAIKVFSHNVEEIRRIIRTVADRIIYSQHVEGDIASYAAVHGLTPGDLIELAASIHERIEKVGFKIEDAPPLPERLGIDETALEQRLKADLQQESESARITDINSLSAIYRLRVGASVDYLEKCRAIFITTNKGLADSSVGFFRAHFKDEGQTNRVQLCMTDVVFATRLWTKLPTSLTKLPRYQLIAHIFGNLRPSKNLRDAFQAKLKELVRDNKLSEEAAYRIALSRFTEQSLALQVEARRDDLNTLEMHNVVNSIIQKQKRLYESIRQGVSEEERKKIRDEIAALDADRLRLLQQASASDAEVHRLTGEAREGEIKLKAMELLETTVKNKLVGIVTWLWRIALCVCIFSLFELIFAFTALSGDTLVRMGLPKVARAVQNIGWWTTIIAGLFTTAITLAGLSLSGALSRIEAVAVRKALRVFFP